MENSYTSAATSGGLVVPRFYSLSNSVKTPAAPTEYDGRKEVDGVFAGATLTYKQYLTLDGTLRRDQSSTLPKDNNSYYYPAVSANFLFSKLLPDLSWLSYGKLRANYAEVGGDAPVYSTRNVFNAGTPFNNQTLFTYTTTNKNADIRPEPNKTKEIGAELAFLHNRLGLDVTYYHSRLSDQIMPITPSAASGFTTFYVNGGTSSRTRASKSRWNAAPVRTRDFSWNIILNWSRNNNKVISLYGGQPSYTIASYQNGIQLVAETGKSYGILRGTDYQYVNGQRLINANGYPATPVPKSDIGNINPDWLGASPTRLPISDLRSASSSISKKVATFTRSTWIMPPGPALSRRPPAKNSLGNPIRNPLSQGGGVVIRGVTQDGKAKY